MKPLLIITRAPPGSCPDCERYSAQIAPHYQRFLRRDGRLDVLQLMKVDKDTIYAVEDRSLPIHPELYNWVSWWPSFIIVTGSSWKDHNAKLDGYIYGGVINPATGKPMEVAGEYNLDNEESLIQWTAKTLNVISSSSGGRKRHRDRLQSLTAQGRLPEFGSGNRRIFRYTVDPESDFTYSESKTAPNI